MSWKKLDSWLKGGLTLLILDFLLIIIIVLTSHPLEAVRMMLILTQIPISLIFYTFAEVTNDNNLIILTLLGLINWFLIGALIGHIIKKIKNKQ